MSTTVPILRSDRRRDYAATAGQTVFSLDVPVFDREDVKVYSATTSTPYFVELTAGWTATYAGPDRNVIVTFDVAPRATSDDPVVTIRVEGLRDQERSTDATRDGVIQSAALESDFDRAVIVQQEQRRDIGDLQRDALRLNRQGAYDARGHSIVDGLPGVAGSDFPTIDQVRELAAAIVAGGPFASFADFATALAGLVHNQIIAPDTLDYVLDQRLGLNPTGTQGPNKFFGSPSAVTKSGGGEQAPDFRYIEGRDLPRIFRGIYAALGRFIPDILSDGPAWIPWAINPKNRFDSLDTIKALMKREMILGIDKGRVYLRGSFPLAAFNNKTILCLVGGSYDGRTTFVCTRNDVPLVDGTGAQNVQALGFMNFAYQQPAAAGIDAFKLADASGCRFDGIGLHNAADGFVANGTNRNNVIRELEVNDCSGTALVLSSGRDLTIGRAKLVRAFIGLSASNSWLGDLKIEDLIARECQHEGLLYDAAGQQDIIKHLSIDNNSLASPGAYDGIRITSGARNLAINSGTVGIGSGWRYANGSIQAMALLNAGEHLFVGAKTYTFVAAGAAGDQINIGASTTTLIANIRDKLQGDGVITADVKVEYFGGVVTITDKVIGTGGNSYVLDTDAAFIKAKQTFHLNTRPIAGGVFVMNGATITFKTAGAVAGNNECNLGTSTASFSGLFLAFLNAATDPLIAAATYTYASSVFTVTCDTPGAAGNAFTLATDQPLAFTLAGPTLAGGADTPALALSGAGTLTGGAGATTQRNGVKIESDVADIMMTNVDLRGNATAAYDIDGASTVNISITGIMPPTVHQVLSDSFIASLPP